MQHVIHCPSSASVTALLCNTMAHINAAGGGKVPLRVGCVAKALRSSVRQKLPQMTLEKLAQVAGNKTQA